MGMEAGGLPVFPTTANGGGLPVDVVVVVVVTAAEMGVFFGVPSAVLLFKMASPFWVKKNNNDFSTSLLLLYYTFKRA